MNCLVYYFFYVCYSYDMQAAYSMVLLNPCLLLQLLLNNCSTTSTTTNKTEVKIS